MRHAARWLGAIALAAIVSGCGDARSGARTPTAPRLTLNPTVVINGPSAAVRPNVECYFFAAASDGMPPYTYTWTQHFGTGYDDGAGGYYATSSTNYSVSVTVTDANNLTATASKSVTVSSSALPCNTP
jgi:hypothetical protein